MVGCVMLKMFVIQVMMLVGVSFVFAPFAKAGRRGDQDNDHRELKERLDRREGNLGARAAMVEQFRKKYPFAEQNLALDYQVARMWLNEQSAYGSPRENQVKFQEYVQMMLKTYSNQLNDIRIVDLLITLEDDILPAMKWNTERQKLDDEWKAKGQEGARPRMPPYKPEQAAIKRQFDFLAEGQYKVTVPKDSPISLDLLVRGTIGRLCGYYGGNDASIENLRVTRGRLIEDLKKDPRTAKYAKEVEDILAGDEQFELMELHPNPPEVNDKPAIPFTDARSVGDAIVKLNVKENAGVDRRGWPVTGGVPLPKGRVKDAGKLCLYAISPEKSEQHRGVQIPCQWTVQSRWPDASIKWLLLEYFADVGASNAAAFALAESERSVEPSKKVSIQVHKLPKAQKAAEPEDAPGPGEQALRASFLPQDEIARAGQKEASGYILDSGRLQIGIATNAPGLIHHIALDGKSIVWADNPVQAVMEKEQYKNYRCSIPKKVTIESSGPLRATVFTEGEFVSDENGTNILSGKVGYEMRTTVYAGKPYAKLDFTLFNHAPYGYRNENRKRQWLYFKYLGIEVPAQAMEVYGKTATNWCARLPQGWITSFGVDLSLEQCIKYPRRDGRNIEDCNSEEEADREEAIEAAFERRSTPYFMVHRGMTAAKAGITNGAISEGWCELMIGQDRLAGAAVRRFWQNAPKGLSVQPEKLTIDLWPGGGFWPRSQKACDEKTYQFEGGREKTTEMLLVFGKDGAGTGIMAKGFESPLIAEAPADWYGRTGVVWPFAPGGGKSKDKEMQEALGRYDRMQLAKVHDEYGDPAGEPTKGWGDDWGKVSITSLRERCPETMCGWMNFGDLVWSHGYCSLHYDWPYLMLVQHLRLGDMAMLGIADDMTRHRYDIDQYHVGDSPDYLSYFQRYEKGEHGHLERQPQNTRNWEHNTAPSHTWNRGLLLWWAMTGDKRALSAALDNGEAYRRFFFQQNKLGEKEKLVYGEFRTPGWALDNWLALHEYTGEQKYLDWANELFTKTLLAMEKENGSKGHILKDGKQGGQFTGYIIEPVCRLHHITGRQDVADFLKRVLDWQREKGTRGGEIKGENYHPVQFLEDMSGESEDGDALGAGVCYDYLFADGYAYLYKVFGRKADLEYARKLFKDGVFYFKSAGGCDPAFRSSLGLHQFGDPFGMAEKLCAYNGRYPLIYLMVEQEAGK